MSKNKLTIKIWYSIRSTICVCGLISTKTLRYESNLRGTFTALNTFMLGDLTNQLNKEASEASINQFNTFLFADDAAFVFKFKTKSRGWIKSQLIKFFGYLSVESHKWGLKINGSNSGVMEMSSPDQINLSLKAKFGVNYV